MEQISPAQELYLNMLEAGGRWGGFHGARIAADLRANLPLWRTAIFTRQPRVPGGHSDTELRHRVDLIALSALPKGEINLDRLFIIPEPGRADALEKLARNWLATEMTWISHCEAARAMGGDRRQFEDYAEGEPRFLLNLWWE
jgi:hypothetical protein